MIRLPLLTLLGSAALLAVAPACSKQNASVPTAGSSAAPAATSTTTAAAPGSAAGQTMMALPTLGAAPAWQLKDVNGAVVSSEQFKGKILVVDFWATWCGPCVVEIPGYVELVKKYGADGLAIVGISLDQAGPPVVKAFASKYGVNYPLVMADENVIAAFGGVEAIPTTFLIDRSGQIRDRKVGAQATAEYEKKILALLK